MSSNLGFAHDSSLESPKRSNVRVFNYFHSSSLLQFWSSCCRLLFVQINFTLFPQSFYFSSSGIGKRLLLPFDKKSSRVCLCRLVDPFNVNPLMHEDHLWVNLPTRLSKSSIICQLAFLKDLRICEAWFSLYGKEKGTIIF